LEVKYRIVNELHHEVNYFTFIQQRVVGFAHIFADLDSPFIETASMNPFLISTAKARSYH